MSATELIKQAAATSKIGQSLALTTTGSSTAVFFEWLPKEDVIIFGVLAGALLSIALFVKAIFDIKHSRIQIETASIKLKRIELEKVKRMVSE